MAVYTEAETRRMAEIEADPDAVSDEIGDAYDEPESDPRTDDQRLESLVQQWLDQNEIDLQLRHATGLWLNDKLGPPSTRQAYGAEVIQGLSDRIHVDKSGLSRMRWYAHHFPDFERFQKLYPAKRSWTQVRELLPELADEASSDEGANDAQENGDDGSQENGAGTGRKKGPVDVLLNSLKRLTSDLNQQNLRLARTRNSESR